MQNLSLMAQALAQSLAGGGLGQHDHAVLRGSAPPSVVCLQRAAHRHGPAGEADEEVAELRRWSLQDELGQLGAIDEADGAHAYGKLARRRTRS